MRYLDCEDHRVCGCESHCTETLFDCFDGVLDLEEVAVGREDCDGCVVHLKYFQTKSKIIHIKYILLSTRRDFSNILG